MAPWVFGGLLKNVYARDYDIKLELHLKEEKAEVLKQDACYNLLASALPLRCFSY